MRSTFELWKYVALLGEDLRDNRRDLLTHVFAEIGEAEPRDRAAALDPANQPAGTLPGGVASDSWAAPGHRPE
jgi:hypothetical protein